MANCNGNRPAVMARKEAEAKSLVPVACVKAIKKKEHKKVMLNSYIIDRIVKNIKSRSSHSHNTQQPIKKVEILDTMISTNDSRYSGKPQTSRVAPGRFDLFHKTIDNTKDERMLKNHETYKHRWAQQMNIAIEAREALQGKVNEAQAINDLTITEKMDGIMFNNKEMRKILSATFDQNSLPNNQQDFAGSLRQTTSGVGRYEQVLCCEKKEEVAHKSYDPLVYGTVSTSGWISECTTAKTKKHRATSYVYASANVSTKNFIPADREIALVVGKERK